MSGEDNLFTSLRQWPICTALLYCCLLSQCVALSAKLVKGPSYVTSWLNREVDHKWGRERREKLKIQNLSNEGYEFKNLASLDEQKDYKEALGHEALGHIDFEKPQDFYKHFEMLKKPDEAKDNWVLVDAVAVHIGNNAYTWREMNQIYLAQEFLSHTGAESLSFYPGLSITSVLYDEAVALGVSSSIGSSGMAEEFLDNLRGNWGISDINTFNKLFNKRVGCPILLFKSFLTSLETAMVMLQHLASLKFTNDDFINFLRQRNLPLSVKYDVDIATLTEADLNAYRENHLQPNWVNFGGREEVDFCPEVQQVLKKLEDDEISEPIALNNEYWLIKKKSTNVIVENKESLLQAMRRLRLEELASYACAKIGKRAVKTLSNDCFVKNGYTTAAQTSAANAKLKEDGEPPIVGPLVKDK